MYKYMIIYYKIINGYIKLQNVYYIITKSAHKDIRILNIDINKIKNDSNKEFILKVYLLNDTDRCEEILERL